MMQPEPEANEVVVTTPEGRTLPNDELPRFMEKLQGGVFYLPQNR